MNAADPGRRAAAAPARADAFNPRRFARGLLRRHWPLVLVIVASMGAYSGFLMLRLGAVGLVVDVAEGQILARGGKPREGFEAGKAGRILRSFEAGWRSSIGGEPPTAGLEVPERFHRFLIGFILAAIVLSGVMAVAFFLKEYLAQKMVLKVIAEVRQEIVDRLLTQSLAFFHRRKAGDLLSRVSNDVGSLQVCLRAIFETLVQDPIAIIAAVTVMFIASWKLALIVLPFYALLFVPIFRSGRKVKRYGRGSLEKLGEVTEDLQQLFTGMRTVKAFGMEEHERRDFKEKNRSYVKRTLKMARAKITGRTFQEVSYNAGTAVFLFLMAWLLYSGSSRLDGGTLAMFLAAMVQIYHPVKSISRAWNQLQESKGGYDRLLEILEVRPRIEDAPGAAEFAGVGEGIRFDGVGFAYDAAPAGNGAASPSLPVLRGVSLEVKAGQVAAIVGPSGAGKSTLVDLLARFYDPTEGSVRVAGEDIRRYRHASYLRSVAIVSQDPFLFNATIEENIAYGRAGASRAEVEEAARRAFAHDFILEQPQGYATRIGERGVMLSGGQRQRLTIARAILKDAPILILDEATSALDSAAEKEVQRALENLMANRTTFIIAHRLSTITHADKIIVLDEGRVVEEGTHEGLLALQGRYWDLHRLQNPRPEPGAAR